MERDDKISIKDAIKYILGIKKEIISEEKPQESFEVPLDADGNGIPDWLEKRMPGALEDDSLPKVNDSGEQDMFFGEIGEEVNVEEKKDEEYPAWLTEKVSFTSDGGEHDIYHGSVDEIEPDPVTPPIEAYEEQGTANQNDSEGLKPKVHEKTDTSEEDKNSLTIGVDMGGEDIQIADDARRRHTHVIGKTGMGKTSLLENMIMQDIKAGRGVGLIDPHGDLYHRILEQIPKSRTNDVVLFDASDTDFPVGFNILENNQNQHTSLIASSLIGVFKKIFGYSWGPRMEYILRNATLTLLEHDDSTLLSLALLLTDSEYRRKVVGKTDNEFLVRFWQEEFFNLAPTRQAEVVSPILNKIGQFLSVPIIRNIVAQPKSSFSLRWVMDREKIFLANLSKGSIGEDVSEMLGSMLVTKFQLDAMSRADLPESDRKTFYMYVDEFQNFATESFTSILSESRKYGLAMTLAHQYIEQLHPSVREAIFGNVASLISFQLGYNDAKIMAPVYGQEVGTSQLTEIPKYEFLTRIRADARKDLFTGSIYPPKSMTNTPNADHIDKILRVTREKFAKPREFVEEKILGKIE